MMMMLPPGAYRPGRSFARVIFTTLASIIFGLSIMLNIYLLIASGLGSGLGLAGAHGFVQTVLVEGDLKQKIAVVPISGIILDNTSEKFSTLMAALEKDTSLKALVLEVDTPGGAVTPSDEIFARIRQFKQRTSKPVVVTMGGLATSGGYYISAAADYVFAQPSTITGNIGVISPRLNFARLAKDYGVEEVTITSPPQGFKNAGSYFQPLKEEERQYLQGLADEALRNFKRAIVTGRPKLKSTIDQVADGKALTAPEALRSGLIDEIGYPTQAYDHAAKLANLSNKYVVRYNKPPTLFDLLGGGADGRFSAPADTSERSGKGITIRVDAGLVDELSRPRLMYLWRGQ